MTSTTRITIADEAELKAAARTTSRIITFPDGQARHITLTEGQWANCDTLIAEGMTTEQLFWVPFDAAKEFVANGQADDFEHELRACIKTLARSGWRWRDGEKQGRPANLD